MYTEMHYFTKAIERKLLKEGNIVVTLSVLQEIIMDAQDEEEQAASDQREAFNNLDPHK